MMSTGHKDNNSLEGSRFFKRVEVNEREDHQYEELDKEEKKELLTELSDYLRNKKK